MAPMPLGPSHRQGMVDHLAQHVQIDYKRPDQAVVNFAPVSGRTPKPGQGVDHDIRVDQSRSPGPALGVDHLPQECATARVVNKSRS